MNYPAYTPEGKSIFYMVVSGFLEEVLSGLPENPTEDQVNLSIEKTNSPVNCFCSRCLNNEKKREFLGIDDPEQVVAGINDDDHQIHCDHCSKKI